MKVALEEHGRFLPPDAQPSEVLEPGDRPLHREPTPVPAQGTTVLRDVLGTPAPTVRRDQFDAVGREFLVQFVAVERLVPDHTLRRLLRQHPVEQVPGGAIQGR